MCTRCQIISALINSVRSFVVIYLQEIQSFFTWTSILLWQQYKQIITLRFGHVLIFIIIPACWITSVLTHHPLIEEKVVLESIQKGENHWNSIHTTSGTALFNHDDDKEYLKNLTIQTNNEIYQIAENFLNIANIDYKICSWTLANDYFSKKYLGDTNNVQIFLRTDRIDDQKDSYRTPNNLQTCRHFGRVNQTSSGSLNKIDHIVFPYEILGTGVNDYLIKIELRATLLWQIFIFLISLSLIGDFWLVILGVFRYVKPPKEIR